MSICVGVSMCVCGGRGMRVCECVSVRVQGKLTTGCSCNGSEGVCADVVVCASVGVEGGESSDDSFLCLQLLPTTQRHTLEREGRRGENHFHHLRRK